jgi:protein-S-isoprenylcysteine O-methyltransferase Ste14
MAEAAEMTEARGFAVAEFLGRAGLAAYFSLAAVAQVQSMLQLIEASPAPDNLYLQVLSRIASLMFLSLIVILALFRLKPSRKAEGIEPRLSAMAATFMLVPLVMIDGGVASKEATVIGIVLVTLGTALSAYVLYWLGRSFSIMAEARKLVDRGPYAIVRHPLYVTEAIAVLGVVVLHWSLIAVLAFFIHCGLQLRRMWNEEKVLRAAFPEYAAYAERTPQWFPMPLGWRRQPA